MREDLLSAWALAKQVWLSWLDDYAMSMGAALAYYTLFSLAPLLLIVVSVAGLFFGEDAARGQIVAQLRLVMGAAGASAVQELLASVRQPGEGLAATLLGIGLLLVGATTVFGELQDALDRIWRAPARVLNNSWLTLVQTRVLSFGMILAIGFLLVVSLLASTGLEVIGQHWNLMLGGWYPLAVATNAVVAFALVTAMFALIYKVMPSVRVLWRDVWIGALFTSLLFTLGKSLISRYIGGSGITSVFGAAGSLVAVLLWVYYSAQIFLIGAEFTWVYANAFGSRKRVGGVQGPMHGP